MIRGTLVPRDFLEACMELKVNQKVLVKKMIRNDGSCQGCSRGTPVAYDGMSGFICDISEFHFEPVYVVHFMDINKKIGFREPELEVLEDFDEETGKWTVIKETPEFVPPKDGGCSCSSGHCG